MQRSLHQGGGSSGVELVFGGEANLQPDGGVVAAPQAGDAFVLLLLASACLSLLCGTCGFALQEAGALRAPSARRVLPNALIVAATAIAAWWCVGFAFAFGTGEWRPNGFIGAAHGYFLSAHGGRDVDDDDAAGGGDLGGVQRFALFLLQAGLATTSAAAVCSALAGRAGAGARAAVAAVWAGFIFPVAAHWTWSTGGWLSGRRDSGGPALGGAGLIDGSGAGAAHLAAGVGALVAAAAAGGAQPVAMVEGGGGRARRLPPGSPALVAAGILMRWVGLFGATPGNAVLMLLPAGKGAVLAAARAAASATIAATAGLLAAAAADACARCLRRRVFDAAGRHPLDARRMLDGGLAALVAVAAGAAVVEPFAAAVIGACAAWLCLGATRLLAGALRDPAACAAATLALPALWGLAAAGLFAMPGPLAAAGYPTPNGGGDGGVGGAFYSGGGRQLGVQLLGGAAIGGWAAATAVPLFLALRASGLLGSSSSNDDDDDENEGDRDGGGEDGGSGGNQKRAGRAARGGCLGGPCGGRAGAAKHEDAEDADADGDGGDDGGDGLGAADGGDCGDDDGDDSDDGPFRFQPGCGYRGAAAVVSARSAAAAAAATAAKALPPPGARRALSGSALVGPRAAPPLRSPRCPSALSRGASAAGAGVAAGCCVVVARAEAPPPKGDGAALGGAPRTAADTQPPHGSGGAAEAPTDGAAADDSGSPVPQK